MSYIIINMSNTIYSRYIKMGVFSNDIPVCGVQCVGLFYWAFTGLCFPHDVIDFSFRISISHPNSPKGLIESTSIACCKLLLGTKRDCK